MKKPRKRYSDREEIIKLIEKVKATQAAESERAELLDAKATELFQWIALRGQPKDRDTIEYHDNLAVAKYSRTEADRLRKYQGRHVKKLERLKHTLAALDTVAMPFLADASVVEQP